MRSGTGSCPLSGSSILYCPSNLPLQSQMLQLKCARPFFSLTFSTKQKEFVQKVLEYFKSIHYFLHGKSTVSTILSPSTIFTSPSPSPSWPPPAPVKKKYPSPASGPLSRQDHSLLKIPQMCKAWGRQGPAPRAAIVPAAWSDLNCSRVKVFSIRTRTNMHI